MHTSKMQRLDDLVQGKTLAELESLLVEKRLLQSKMSAIASNLPVSLEKRVQTIQELEASLALAKDAFTRDKHALAKTEQGLAAVAAVTTRLEQEIKRRGLLMLHDIVDLTPNEWSELEDLVSLVEDIPRKGLRVENKPTHVDIQQPRTHAPDEVANIAHLTPSTLPNRVAVSMAEDFNVSRAICKRWQITKGTHLLKPLLGDYQKERMPRDFAIDLPVIDSCKPGVNDCVACNKKIDDEVKARLVEYCDKCAFHVTCAAVHLDYCSSTSIPGQVCIGRVFGKCPNGRSDDIAARPLDALPSAKRCKDC